jgi:hypothetical protein
MRVSDFDKAQSRKKLAYAEQIRAGATAGEWLLPRATLLLHGPTRGKTVDPAKVLIENASHRRSMFHFPRPQPVL